jgi:hypothetical protein
MFQRFPDTVDYFFSYSDTSSNKGYDPTRERFTIGIGDVVDGMNAVGDGEGEDPQTRG